MVAEQRVEHTPGPWRLSKDGTYTAQRMVILGEDNYFDDGSPRVIAETEHVETDPYGLGLRRVENAEEIEANARLIAAAPDLLAACEQTEAELGVVIDFLNEVATDPAAWVDVCIHRLQDVIRQARGES